MVTLGVLAEEEEEAEKKKEEEEKKKEEEEEEKKKKKIPSVEKMFRNMSVVNIATILMGKMCTKQCVTVSE